ncbi:MAG: DUF72 domain-containing protein [Bdellovibrionales bacterium]
MEFGKLESIEHISWSLPADDLLTQPFLASLGAQKNQTKFYIGAPAWGRKEWIGQIYPPKTAATDFLYHYSRNFNCIELNTTHYRIPTHTTVQTWLDKVPSDFLFCPKIPQLISHDPGGLRDEKFFALWMEALNTFGAHLGPCFMQLPPHFGYERKAELFHFLQKWPETIELSLELRHPSWFQHNRILPALVEYLQSRKIGLVITDVAGRRDVLHTSISSNFSILRFIGNDLHPSDFERAKMWSDRISQWREWGLPRFFFMVHEPDDIKTPQMTAWLVHELNENCGADLKPLTQSLV